MKNNIKIAVIGGTGKSGKYLVQELIRQGCRFKILVRNPENFKIENSLIEVVDGDVADYVRIKQLIGGCNAVISTLGWGIPPSTHTIFSLATQNIIRAMTEKGVKRYIVVSGLNVATPFDKKSSKTEMATKWMYVNYPESTRNRQEEYSLLSASDVDWTLVRLPMIELTDARREIGINLEDCLGDKMSATDLAQFLINQLNDSRYIKQAPFVFNV